MIFLGGGGGGHFYYKILTHNNKKKNSYLFALGFFLFAHGVTFDYLFNVFSQKK